MAKDNVTKLLQLSNRDAKRYIQEIARDSSKVAFSRHASERMHERHITRKQVLNCLYRFKLVEPPHRTPRGNWQMAIEAHSIDGWIKIALCLDSNSQGNYIIIITVINI